MDYISTREAAEKWGISERRIQKLCGDDRIVGAVRFVRVWAIPKNTEKCRKAIGGMEKEEMKKIMVIEDDVTIMHELTKLLENNGYQVCHSIHYGKMTEDILALNPNLILLDINLPESDGFTICSQIRCVSQVPIIFVTGRKSDIDELSGIALGGDDFVTKPYNPAILLARINRILQRNFASGNNGQILCHNNVSLDVGMGQIIYHGCAVDLTKTETKIMHCLFTNKGSVTLREKLMDVLWNNNIFIDNNVLSVNITRIREKLADVGLADFVITKRGRGYMI
jgi:DNA-binding response OmpR family regulator